MTDGEHYIRNLSDSELERFVGLNRNMYTKPELHIADDEMAKRKRSRAAKAAQPQPAAAQPQANKTETASPPAIAAPIQSVEFHINDIVIPDVKIPELPKLEDLELPAVKLDETKTETAKPEAAKPQAPKPEEPAQPAQAAKPARIPAAANKNNTMPSAGAPAVPDEPKPSGAFMFCTTCGRKLALDAEYCTNCGNRVSLNDVTEKAKPVRQQSKVYYGPSNRAYRTNMDCCGSDECG